MSARRPIQAWSGAPVSSTGHRWPCELFHTPAERGQGEARCSCGAEVEPAPAGPAFSSQAGLAALRYRIGTGPLPGEHGA